MKLINAALSTLLILAMVTAKTTASPISKVASGETVKLTQIVEMTTSEVNMEEIPFLHGKYSDVDFFQNNISWVTPIGIRTLQISSVLFLNKDFTIKTNNDGNNHTTIFIRKDTNEYTYSLDPKNQTATRSNGNIIHEVDELSHSKHDSSQSIFMNLFISMIQPDTIKTKSYLKYFHSIGKSHLLNYECQKLTYQLSKKLKQRVELWVAHINGKNVLLRVCMIDKGILFVVLDTLAIQTVKPPKDFLNIPAGYTIKVSKE